MSEFGGRALVVTGGGGALGHAVVATLIARGANVHVPARSERGAEALRALGAQVETGVDLRDEAQVKAFYSPIPDIFASIHLAGGFVFGAIEGAALSDLRAMLSMNVETTWLCCREAARAIRGEGRIVNVCAKPALVPTPQLSAYAASKGAVMALTLSLSEELRDRGIWVNAIAPSIMDTPANRAAMPEADPSRWPTVEEVAMTIAFLSSPQNQSTRGAIVPVYGRS